MPTVGASRQVAIASGSRTVFIAGQVAWDDGGATVGVGDPAAAGATFRDVAKPTVHVVDRTPDKMPLLMDGVARAAGRLTPLPAGGPAVPCTGCASRRPPRGPR
ncbi:hypothetical protein [Streptomyces sp. NPDC058157]|uniref:hypothetical protein n=1 Tax=Streptomyces sp. NPDC058157 TaxID=3346360 RepID=UPI0036E885EF